MLKKMLFTMTLLLGAFALTPQPVSAGTFNPAVMLGKTDVSSGIEQVRWYRYRHRHRPMFWHHHRRWR